MSRTLPMIPVALFAGGALGMLLGNAAAGVSLGLLLVLLAWQRAARRLQQEVQDGREPRQPLFGPLESLRKALLRERGAQYRERARLLRAGLDRFRRVAEALPDAVLLLDRDGSIEWSNQAARHHLRIHRRDRGRRLQHLLRQPALTQALSACARGLEQELRLPGATGPLELRLLALEQNSMLLLARDVTAAERTERMRRDFIADLSHELRTPLTVLCGFLEELDRDAHPGLAQALPAMQREVRRMETLTKQLLQLARLESAAAPPGDTPVPMGQLLRELEASMRRDSRFRGQQLQLLARPGLDLRGEYSELYSACANLLGNALQYTPPGRKITVQWQPDQHQGAVLEVLDEGSGIAPRHLPLLTRRFYRADQGRGSRHGNLGLGLAIVKHVLLRHNAELQVTSRLGQGSSFRCTFPAERILDRSKHDQAQATQPAPAKLAGGRTHPPQPPPTRGPGDYDPPDRKQHARSRSSRT